MALPDPCPTILPRPNTTAPCLSDAAWVKVYLTSHSMSLKSRFYGYIFWVFIAATIFTLTLTRLLSLRGGPLGTYWNALALGRKRLPSCVSRVYNELMCRRTERSRPIFLPSNGRLLGMFALTSVALALTFAGPDYLPPGSEPGQPMSAIQKSWWTSGARAGILSFALLPLCILFALKGSPFAVLSFKFTLQMYFDKLAWLHRWTAGLIWVLSCYHVGSWTVQLMIDRHPTSDDMVFTYVWKYGPFIYGWTAFFLLTLIIVLALKPFRNGHYELFYALHVLFVPLMLVMVAFHHPQMWLWAWCSLAMWVGERSWRGARYLHLNYIPNHSSLHYGRLLRRSSFIGYIPIPSIPATECYPPNAGVVRHKLRTRYHPPPGFAHAEIVAGTTVRVTYMPPHKLTWAPGQHFLINIPSVSRFTSHPFTSGSSYESPCRPNLLIFFIRVKNGWTKDLWDQVVNLCSKGSVSAANEALPQDADLPASGVLLRMNIDGPFGSSGRIWWESYSGAVIVVGGSGVSFGLSILEHLCYCIAQRKRRAGEDFEPTSGKLSRVRFVWIVQEYGHIQWAASTLRRCATVAESELDINIFVTRLRQRAGPTTDLESEPLHFSGDTISLSSTYLARRNTSQDTISSSGGRHLADSLCDTCEADPQNGGRVETDPTMLAITDLTAFEGDRDVELPGEKKLNKLVKRESKVRRTQGKRSDSGILRSNSRGCLEPDSTLLKPSPVASTRSKSYDHRTRWTRAHIPNAPGSVTSFRAGPVPFSFTSTNEVGKEISPSHSREPSDGFPSAGNFVELMRTASDGSDRSRKSDRLRFQLQVNEQEARDIMIVAEYARPGRPKLEHIIRDEVRGADGPVVVACCGPASLNTLVRRCVASQIDPCNIWETSGRGHISFISEEFDY